MHKINVCKVWHQKSHKVNLFLGHISSFCGLTSNDRNFRSEEVLKWE